VSRVVSIGTQIKQLSGLLATSDLTPWEQEFVQSVAERSRTGEDTTRLSEKQVGVVERIYRKHFS
jgi:hypothetical protein